MTTKTTQLDAVRVLTGIVRRADEAGLPRLAWSIGNYDGDGLHGQPQGGDDADRTAALEAWAGHLGVEVETEARKGYTSVEFRTEVDGVPVWVFTHTDETFTYVQVPREQAGGAK